MSGLTVYGRMEQIVNSNIQSALAEDVFLKSVQTLQEKKEVYIIGALVEQILEKSRTDFESDQVLQQLRKTKPLPEDGDQAECYAAKVYLAVEKACKPVLSQKNKPSIKENICISFLKMITKPFTKW